MVDKRARPFALNIYNQRNKFKPTFTFHLRESFRSGIQFWFNGVKSLVFTRMSLDVGMLQQVAWVALSCVSCFFLFQLQIQSARLTHFVDNLRIHLFHFWFQLQICHSVAACQRRWTSIECLKKCVSWQGRSKTAPYNLPCTTWNLLEMETSPRTNGQLWKNVLTCASSYQIISTRPSGGKTVSSTKRTINIYQNSASDFFLKIYFVQF